MGLRPRAGAQPLTGPTAPTTAAQTPIRRLLVANRGEIAVRIAGTCRRLGIACVALVSADQRDAWWAMQADERVMLEGSYLDADAVLQAARRAPADAIHPGYGFLAESAAFAAAVIDAGLTWVGPPPGAMEALGDKAAARRLAASLGVPTLPGYDGDDQSDDSLEREARAIGYPLLVKPSAGGGGKGMHVVRAAGELAQTIARARREAKAAFGDDRLVLERYLERPRHVEVQLLFDAHGNGIHLGERDCSLQRRHQKVIEEAPSPAVDERRRDELGACAVRLAAGAGYVGAGTAEFLLDEAGTFYFIELNARLQVEHPVTEAVTGRDLVEDQLRIAAGEPLSVTQSDVRVAGHAIEARLYAEDPWNDFLPTTGEVRQLDWPGGEGVRVDAGVGVHGDADEPDEIGTRYDPLLAKLIAHAPTRPQALERLAAALAETRLGDVVTNRGFLAWLLELDEVREGDARTDTIARRWHPEPGVPEAAWSVAAAVLAKTGVSGSSAGFRMNAPRSLRVLIGDEQRAVPLPSDPDALPSYWSVVAPHDWIVRFEIDGRPIEARIAPPPTVDDAVRHATREDGGARAVTASMPGTVLDVRVSEGEDVEAHHVLVVLEAMKMENAVTAPVDARISRVLVAPGQSVQRGDPLVELG